MLEIALVGVLHRMVTGFFCVAVFAGVNRWDVMNKSMCNEED